MTLPGMSDSIYENTTYKVLVGMPPVTPEMPNPLPCYLIINKETGVTESWHGILAYAKQNADLFHEMLHPKQKDADVVRKEPFSFN